MVLVPLGAGVGLVGSVVTRYRSEVAVVGGLVLIGFGLMTLLGEGFGLSSMQRLTARINISGTRLGLRVGSRHTDWRASALGPLLGAVQTMSAMGGDPAYGAPLMAVYALGWPLRRCDLLAWVWIAYHMRVRLGYEGRPVRLGRLETLPLAAHQGRRSSFSVRCSCYRRHRQSRWRALR